MAAELLAGRSVGIAGPAAVGALAERLLRMALVGEGGEVRKKCVFSFFFEKETLCVQVPTRALLALAGSEAGSVLSALQNRFSGDTSVAEAVAVLALLRELARAAPSSLLPHLGAAVLLVARPLDPALPHRRRACLAPATSALQTLMTRFPMARFHEASQRVAVGTSAGTVLLVDLATGAETARLSGHSGAVAAVAFSPSGARLASFCLAQSQIRIYALNGSFFGFGSAPHCVASFPSDTGKDARARSATQLQMLEQLELKWQGETALILVRGWLGTQTFQVK